MSFPDSRKTAAIVLALLFFLITAVFVIAASEKRTAELRTRDWIVRLLRERFRSDVELADFHVRVFPRMSVSGEGLSLHYWATPDAPPLIGIEKFSFDLGFWGIFRLPHRIRKIHLQRMVITIPQRGQRNAVPHADNPEIRQVLVGEIESDNAALLILPTTPGKEPLDWEIHHLVLRNVGAGKPFSFAGTLTNAKPKGEIGTIGMFGPWNADDPGATAVSGSYGFKDADLGPFPGIAGMLSSEGKYSGELDRLEVQGETDTPNFSLDQVGRPVPLHTEYSATVDGTNGDTQLHPVRATLGKSVIVAVGSVINVPTQNGHRITLDVTTPNARIEDILQLGINSDKPFLRGPINVTARLLVPPGKEKVIEKMSLDGTFALTQGRWTNEEVREKLESFSRHAEGKPNDQDAGSAVTDLRGKFVLKDSVITFSELTFSVPGAGVELAGTYDINSQKIDMRGRLKTQAKLSQTVTGAKSFFLKAIDPLFSKHGAGAELPISISGTQENPVFAVTVLHKKIERPMGKPGML